MLIRFHEAAMHGAVRKLLIYRQRNKHTDKKTNKHGENKFVGGSNKKKKIIIIIIITITTILHPLKMVVTQCITFKPAINSYPRICN